MGSIDVPQDVPFGEEETGWPRRVQKTALKTHYTEWCAARKKKEENPIAFNAQVTKFGGKVVRAAKDKDGKRHQVWNLPSLDESIEMFAKATGVNL